jgi:hypothetical protein
MPEQGEHMKDMLVSTSIVPAIHGSRQRHDRVSLYFCAPIDSHASLDVTARQRGSLRATSISRLASLRERARKAKR